MWQTLSGVEDLIRIADRWAALAERDCECTVYQRPDWVIACVRHFGLHRSCHVLILEDGSELAAVFPMWIRVLSGLRVLEFVGARGTDYLAPVTTAADRRTVYASLLRMTRTLGVDIVSFEDIPADHSLVEFCTTSHPTGAMAVSLTCRCYRIDLPPTWAEFTKTLSPRKQSDVAHERRRIKRVCGERVPVRASGSSGFALHARLHQMRRQSIGNGGAYRSSEALAMLRDITQAWEEQGMLRQTFLQCGDRAIATMLAAAWRDRIYCVTLGFDPAAHRLSPGAVLMGFSIERAINDGAEVFDLSRGDDSYKTSWGAKAHDNLHVVVARNTAALEAYERACLDHFAGRDFTLSTW